MSPVPANRTLAQQLREALVVFGLQVVAAFALTALSYGIGWGRLTPQVERKDGLPRANQVLIAAVGSVPKLAAAVMATRLAEQQWRSSTAVVGVALRRKRWFTLAS